MLISVLITSPAFKVSVSSSVMIGSLVAGDCHVNDVITLLLCSNVVRFCN